MKTFLRISGAIVIGSAIAFTSMFPILVVGIVVGYIWLKENEDKEDNPINSIMMEFKDD